MSSTIQEGIRNSLLLLPIQAPLAIVGNNNIIHTSVAEGVASSNVNEHIITKISYVVMDDDDASYNPTIDDLPNHLDSNVLI